MDTSAKRADRLHAIWQRRCARFREAHYAYRLADEHCDRVGRTHASYAQARALATRAVRLMDILHRQTAKLARLQIAAVGLASAAATTPATAADEWTSTQVTQAAALATLVGVHWLQLHSDARHGDTDTPMASTPHQPDRSYAARYSGPSQAAPRHANGDIGQINRQFLLGTLIGAAALHALPTPYRDWALNAGLVIEAGCVANNLRLGIGIKF